MDPSPSDASTCPLVPFPDTSSSSAPTDPPFSVATPAARSRSPPVLIPPIADPAFGNVYAAGWSVHVMVPSPSESSICPAVPLPPAFRSSALTLSGLGACLAARYAE